MSVFYKPLINSLTSMRPSLLVSRLSKNSIYSLRSSEFDSKFANIDTIPDFNKFSWQENFRFRAIFTADSNLILGFSIQDLIQESDNSYSTVGRLLASFVKHFLMKRFAKSVTDSQPSHSSSSNYKSPNWIY